MSTDFDHEISEIEFARVTQSNTKKYSAWNSCVLFFADFLYVNQF